jgi:hypothetical protein
MWRSGIALLLGVVNLGTITLQREPSAVCWLENSCLTVVESNVYPAPTTPWIWRLRISLRLCIVKDGDQMSASRSGRFTAGKDPPISLDKVINGPAWTWWQREKFSRFPKSVACHFINQAHPAHSWCWYFFRYIDIRHCRPTILCYTGGLKVFE